MSSQARVTSVDALAAFMAQLVNYRDNARSTVEEISGDVLRLRQWLQMDQRIHWEGQIRRRTRLLEEAQQRLYSAELASLREPTVEERMAVRKAKAALEEAQESLLRVKRWQRDFDSRIEPEVRKLNSLHTFLSKDASEAIASLDAMIKALEDYGDARGAAKSSPASENPATAPVSTPPAGEPGDGGGLKLPGEDHP